MKIKNKNINTSTIILTLTIIISIFMICTQITLGVVITDGLVLYSSLNDNTTSTTITSQVGTNGNTSSNTNNMSVNGKLLSAFNTTVNYGMFPDSSVYDTQNYTITFWAKTNSTTQEMPISKYFDGANRQFRIDFNNGAPGTFSLFNGLNAVSYTNASFNDNQFHFYTFIFNNGTSLIYIDNVLRTNTTATSVPLYNGAPIYIGNYDSSQFKFNGTIDEVGFWNRTLNNTEIAQIYNSGNGITYPFTNATIPSYNVTNTNIPTIINTSTFTLNITTIIASNTTNVSTLTNPYTQLYYAINTSLNNGCAIFYQKQCQQDLTSSIINMTRNSNSNFTLSLDDGRIFPAYYPFNYQFIESTQGLNYSNYNHNFVKFNIFNFSTTSNNTYLTLEMDAQNISGSSNMLIYYCNSSYTTGDPATSSNCVLVQNYIPQNWNHQHNISKHDVVPFNINTIQKTQVSYIIFLGQGNNNNQRWDFRYVTNATYDNTSFNIGNYNTWSNTTNIFDMHVHQYSTTSDYFTYYTKFYDNNGYSNTSSTSILYYNFTHVNPTTPVITNNCNINATYGGGEQYTINWTPSSSANNLPITYYYQAYDPFYGGFNDIPNCYIGDNINTTYCNVSIDQAYNDGNLASLLAGVTLDTRICAIDSQSGVSCDVDDSNTIPSGCTLYICTTNFVKQLQPCINGLSLIYYQDTNYCNKPYGLPVNNGTYEACVVAPTKNIISFDTNLTIVIFIMIIIIIAIIIGLVLKKGIFFYISGIMTLLLGIFMKTTYAVIDNYGMFAFMIIGLLIFLLGIFIKNE